MNTYLDTVSYECYELSTHEECEAGTCSCDCHDEQRWSHLYGWQRVDDGTCE